MSAPDSIDHANIINIKALHPPMLMRGSTRKRVVIKRGPVTGLTVGFLGSIEAVVRRPLDGVDVVAWAWPVTTFIVDPQDALRFLHFSLPGDSGSLAFDMDGIAVGMVDAGLGRNEMPRRTFQHQAEQAGSAATTPPTNPTASPSLWDGINLRDQLAEPLDHMFCKAEGGLIDITLLTPIDAVFASIEKVTGQTPRMI